MRIPVWVVCVTLIAFGLAFAFLLVARGPSPDAYNAYWFAMHETHRNSGIPLGSFPSFDECVVRRTAERGIGVFEAYKVTGVLRLPEGKAARWSSTVECGAWVCTEVECAVLDQ